MKQHNNELLKKDEVLIRECWNVWFGSAKRRSFKNSKWKAKVRARLLWLLVQNIELPIQTLWFLKSSQFNY